MNFDEFNAMFDSVEQEEGIPHNGDSTFQNGMNPELRDFLNSSVEDKRFVQQISDQIDFTLNLSEKQSDVPS